MSGSNSTVTLTPYHDGSGELVGWAAAFRTVSSTEGDIAQVDYIDLAGVNLGGTMPVGWVRIPLGGGSGLPTDVYMDEYGNLIFGAANVATFPTDRAGELSGIYVDADASFTPPSAGVEVTGLKVYGDATCDLSGLVNATSYMRNVVVTGGSLVANDSATAACYITEVISNGSSVTLTIVPTFEYVEMYKCTFNGSTITLTSTGTNGAAMDTLTVNGGNVSVDDCSLYNFTINSATVTATGGGNFNYIGTINNGTVTMDGIVSNCHLDLQGATLNLGGFDATNVTCFGLPANPTTLSAANTGTYCGFGLDTLVD